MGSRVRVPSRPLLIKPLIFKGFLYKTFTKSVKKKPERRKFKGAAKKIINLFEGSNSGLVLYEGKLIEKPVLREMHRIVNIFNKINDAVRKVLSEGYATKDIAQKDSKVISTSEIKISVLINKNLVKKAISALHKEFKLEK